MAGPHTHIYIAKQVVLENPDIIPNRQIRSFLMGNLIPDVSLWPGGPPLWSPFLHLIGNMTFCKRMVELSSSAESRALALGMLLHILVDLYGHRMINRIAAKHYATNQPANPDGKRGLTSEENPAAHVAIEAGFDFVIYRETQSWDEFGMLYYPDEAITSDCPLVQAFRECYAQELDVAAFRRAVHRFPKLLSRAMRCQIFFNTHPVGQAVGAVLANVLPPMFGSKGQWVVAVIRPYLPTQIDCLAFRDALQWAIESWKGSITGVEPWPEEDFNLDTGLPSRRGGHKTADQLMDELISQNTPNRIQQRFGEGADAILHRWEQIRARFEGGDSSYDCAIT